jgi:hypothetical protein
VGLKLFTTKIVKPIVTNVEEFNSLVKELDAVMTKVKSHRIKLLNGKEIPIIQENQYLSLIVLDKGTPSPDYSIHDLE